MESGAFKGSYPGGPRRDPETGTGQRRRELESVGDMDERALAESLRVRRQRRTRRIFTLFLVVFGAAAGVGLWFGVRSRTTAHEITEELNTPSQPAASTEQDRMLREILQRQRLQQGQGQQQGQTAPAPVPSTRP